MCWKNKLAQRKWKALVPSKETILGLSGFFFLEAIVVVYKLVWWWSEQNSSLQMMVSINLNVCQIKASWIYFVL